jgi:hypothetical protein
MCGICSKYGEIRNAHKFRVREHLAKIPFGRLRRRWQSNIKIDFGYIYIYRVRKGGFVSAS